MTSVPHVDNDTRWAPEAAEPGVDANAQEVEAARAKIRSRGIDWAAEEIASLRRRLTSHKARVAKQFK